MASEFINGGNDSKNAVIDNNGPVGENFGPNKNDYESMQKLSAELMTSAQDYIGQKDGAVNKSLPATEKRQQDNSVSNLPEASVDKNGSLNFLPVSASTSSSSGKDTSKDSPKIKTVEIDPWTGYPIDRKGRLPHGM